MMIAGKFPALPPSAATLTMLFPLSTLYRPRRSCRAVCRPSLLAVPWLVILVGGVGWLSRASAHQPDTSYARIAISREALDCKFTFDLYTLAVIIPGLDENLDRQISAKELAAHTAEVFAFLSEQIQLEVDGMTATFGEPQSVSFPTGVGEAIPEKDYHAATSLVDFAFRRPLAQPATDVWLQFDFFEELGEVHAVLAAFEYQGAQTPVIFRFYEPDYLFDTGFQPTALAKPEVVEPSLAQPNSAETELAEANNTESVVTLEQSADVAGNPEPRSLPHRRSNQGQAWWRQLVDFFWLGVEHIFIGVDHILFLLSLLVICRFKELLAVVTSFTVAHTITLILATLEIIQIPGRLVETAIAATIVYVALENLWIRDTSHRWLLTFAFGLIHGFGFAGVLRELGLPTVGLVRSLVAFNVGVEAGQLAIVAGLFPAIRLMHRWRYGLVCQQTISVLIALCGLGWLIDRSLGLGWMPF